MATETTSPPDSYSKSTELSGNTMKSSTFPSKPAGTRRGQKCIGHGTMLLNDHVQSTPATGTNPLSNVRTSSPRRTCRAATQPRDDSTRLAESNPPAGQTAQPSGLFPASHRWRLDSEKCRVTSHWTFVVNRGNHLPRRAANGACPPPAQDGSDGIFYMPVMPPSQPVRARPGPDIFLAWHTALCLIVASGDMPRGRNAWAG